MKRHIEIERIDKGVIHDRTDLVTFRVKNQCVVFRPSKGEILGAVVTMVKKFNSANPKTKTPTPLTPSHCNSKDVDEKAFGDVTPDNLSLPDGDFSPEISRDKSAR